MKGRWRGHGGGSEGKGAVAKGWWRGRLHADLFDAEEEESDGHRGGQRHLGLQEGVSSGYGHGKCVERAWSQRVG